MIVLGKQLTPRLLLTCQVEPVESPVKVASLCQPVIPGGGGRSTVLHQIKEVRDTKEFNVLLHQEKAQRESVSYHSAISAQHEDTFSL